MTVQQVDSGEFERKIERNALEDADLQPSELDLILSGVPT
jgi:hypothetical protein